MAPVVHQFDPPDRFVAGTVGPPGQRTFFLQARAGSRLVSITLEKQQVAALAERIDALLDQVMTESAGESVVPAVAPHDLLDNSPLDQPIEEEFRAGTMTLSWDPHDKRVVVEVFPRADEVDLATPDAEEVEPSEVFLVRLAPGSARAFVHRAEQVIGAGRPTCPFCGEPIETDGHLCVRANGFRRRDP
ncbi:MAG: DUF3090 domain-containing protein [Nocardioides sp.]